MRPMSQMSIMQINTTLRCAHQCSGCTRLMGHAKFYDMELGAFKLAVDSLRDHPGMCGMIGGDPVLHPQFAEQVEYLMSKIGPPPDMKRGVEPILDLGKYRNDYLADIHVKRGLWTSLPPKAYDHWALICQAFPYICLNTHETPGLHQQILVASGELPISKEERDRKIQSCWLQNNWSASIGPKGCFPCEVMESLDYVFQGPGGWPIEKGWWRRDQKDWGKMLEWCQMCGAAMDVPRLLATEQREIVSPKNYDRLKEIGSPRVKAGKVVVFDVANYDPSKWKADKHAEWYLPKNGDNAQRVAPTNKTLHPKKVELLLVCVGYADFLRATLAWNMKQFDRTVVVTSSDDLDTQQVAKEAGATLVVSDRHKENGAAFNKGKLINEGFKALDFDDWVMLSDADVLFMPNFRQEFMRRIWNPGVLYYGTRFNTPPTGILPWVERFKKNPALANRLSLGNPADNQMPWGYFQLFNCRAQTIRGQVPTRQIYPENFTTAGGVDKKFHEGWPTNRKRLAPPPTFKVVHMYHGKLGTNWAGRRSRRLVTDPPARMVNAPSPEGWRIVGWLDIHGYNFATDCPAGGFIKLVRTDTGQAAIGRNLPPPKGETVSGGQHHGGQHWGLIDSRHRMPVVQANRGRVCLYKQGRFEFSGWGLGHTMWADKPSFVWDGRAIPATTIEVYWKQVLGDDDQKLLVNFNGRMEQ